MAGAPQHRRLRALGSHVQPIAAAAIRVPVYVGGHHAGSRAVSAASGEGGRPLAFAPPIALPPPVFDARAADQAPAMKFFDTYGLVVLGNALAADEVAWLNGWFDASQRTDAVGWGVPSDPDGKGEWSLGASHCLRDGANLSFPPLDALPFHRGHYGLVAALLGGDETTFFSDLMFRETPPTGTAQRFHQDNGTAATSHPERIAAKGGARRHEYICAMHYLSDVSAASPCFSVIPQSQRFIASGGWPEGVHNGAPEAAPDALQQFEAVCDASGIAGVFQPVFCHAPAGTCVLYDINSFHARQDAATPGSTTRRRAMHSWYSRGDVPPMMDFILLPKRLVEHDDPAVRRFYSLQAVSDKMRWYRARGYTLQGTSVAERAMLFEPAEGHVDTDYAATYAGLL